MAGYPKEALLYAPVGCAHDHLVTLGDQVLDREFLIDGADLAKEFTNSLWAGRKSSRWTAVHRPGRSGHLANLLDFMFVDEFDPTASDRFVLLYRAHPRASSSLATATNQAGCRPSTLTLTAQDVKEGDPYSPNCREGVFSATQFPAIRVLGNLSLSCVALYVLRGQWLHRTFPQGACCLYLMSCREGYPSRKLSLPSTPPSGGGHVRGRPNWTRSQSFSNRVRRDYHSSSGAGPPGAISYA